MSGSQPQMGGTPPGSGADPSMEDILASIRRILSEEDSTTATPPAAPVQHQAKASPAELPQDVLVLDNSMRVPDPPPPPPPPLLKVPRRPRRWWRERRCRPSRRSWPRP